MRSTGRKKQGRSNLQSSIEWGKVAKRSALVGIIVVMFILLTGGCLNPALWGEQMQRRVEPAMLLRVDEQTLEQIESEFKFFKNNRDAGLVPPCFAGERTVFHDVYCYVASRITYGTDVSTFYAIDYLATPSETLQKGIDDCDGRAVLMCTLLLKRGYDAEVVMGTEHTWVEASWNGSHVYMAHGESVNPVLITNAPLEDDQPWYVRFDASSAQWRPWPLIFQSLVVFSYVFAVVALAHIAASTRMYSRPLNYVSEMLGYFKYILYLFMVIFCIWVFLLLLIEFLSKMQ
ncbi:hypothetical protein EF808_05405 [archaeon]|nr:MAG: hypothetical protein EF808_05405 [archaeon]